MPQSDSVFTLCNQPAINLPISQSVTLTVIQVISQPVNSAGTVYQQVNQSISQPIHDTWCDLLSADIVYLSINKSVNQSISQPIHDAWCDMSADIVYLSINKSVSRSISQPIHNAWCDLLSADILYLSVNQSVSQPIHDAWCDLFVVCRHSLVHQSTNP